MKQNGRSKGSGPQTVSLPERDTPPFNQTNGNGKNISEISFCPGPLPDVQSSFLKSIRQRKNLSQQTFAAQLGISKVQLQRLESKDWTDFSVKDLQTVSKVLGIRPETLFQNLEGFARHEFRRSQRGTAQFVMEYDGIRFDSFLPVQAPFFIGLMTLKPRKTLLAEDAPPGEFLFYEVLEGELLLTLSKDFLFKPGEYFILKGSPPYELYNPHQFNPLVLKLHASPSFFRESH